MYINTKNIYENKCSEENKSPCGSKGKKCKNNDKKIKKIKIRKTKTEMRNLKMIGYAKIVGIIGMMTGKSIALAMIYVEANSIFSALESSIELLNTGPWI